MRHQWIAMMLALSPSVMLGQGTVRGGGGAPEHAAELSVRSLMSTGEFAAAGLQKLSQTELRELSAWLRARTLLVAEVVRAAALNPEPAPAGNPGVIETQMAGDFTGWDGATVFQLANGQLWQQSSFGSLYHFVRSPKVTLIATPSGWRLGVDGVPQTIYVRRVR